MKRLKYIATLFLAVTFSWSVQAQENPAKIISVSVDSSNYPTIQGRVNIIYQPTSLTDVEYFNLYIIKNGDNQKVHVLPTSDSTYLYTEAKAHKQSEGFRLSAEPDLSYPITAPHYTIFLQTEGFDSCTFSIPLIWNNYVGWTNSIKTYEVYVKKGNNAYKLVANTTDTVYNYTPADFETTYLFFVKVISNSDLNSLSNIITINTGIWTNLNQDECFIDTLINNETQSQISIHTDSASLISSVLLYGKKNSNDSYTALDTILVNSTNRYSYTGQSNYYKADVFNNCQQPEIETNTVQVIDLSGTNTDNLVKLNWNKSFIDLDESFEIQLNIDDAGFSTIDKEILNTQNTYNLLELGTDQSETFCFRCISHSKNDYYSQSNTICFKLLPSVKMANAFTPNNDGLNDTFGPIIQNAQINDYIFIIYDRYGDKVFESKNESDRWNGTFNAKTVSEGLYLYYLKFSTQSGSQYEKSGTVNIIYP